jgi:hypothetical protein
MWEDESLALATYSHVTSILGFLRGLGVIVLAAVLTYIGDATNLQGILTPRSSALIAMIALSIEHSIEGKTGNALFGAVKTH